MAIDLPPLVAEGEELTPQELDRYSRHVAVPGLGVSGQRRLKNARVLVLGAGGLGSPVLLYLAAAGVGTLGVLDVDVVEASNLQRQVIHGVPDVGRSKVDSARRAVERVNPLVTVVPHETRLDAGNALELLAGYDVVIDGTDNFATRYLTSDAAAILGMPCVWGSIDRFHGQVALFWSAPPSPAPGITYRDLYPEAPPAGAVPTCAEGGVLGVLPGTVGAMMATEAIKLITGLGDTLLGRVALYDALGPAWRVLTVVPDPELAPVTDLDRHRTPAEHCALPGVATEESVDPSLLARLLADDSAEDLLLVDLREPHERASGMIPGAVAVPFARVASSPADHLPVDRRVVLYCQSGGRSAVALRSARMAGIASVAHLEGGMTAWLRTGSEVAPDRGTRSERHAQPDPPIGR